MKSPEIHMKRWIFAVITALALAGVARAGENHEGYGSTKIAAIENANEVAREAAKKKGTCWKGAKMENCKKDADGYWTAYSASSNHRGSCGKDGYREP